MRLFEIKRQSHLIRMLLAFMVSGGVSESFARSGAVAFPIVSQSSQRTVNCTATAMILNGQCGIFTNRHCLIDGQNVVTLMTYPDDSLQVGADDINDRHRRDLKLWKSWVGAQSEFGFRAIQTRVLKRSRKYDLAELAIPASVRDKLCVDARLHPQSSSQTRRFLDPGDASLAAASLGFTGLNPRIEYTGNDPWWSSWVRLSIMRPYPMSTLPGDVLLLLKDLDILPGMSGGFSVEKTNLMVLGLNARYIPLQSVGFVLPLSSIEDFRNETVSIEVSNERPTHLGFSAEDARVTNSTLFAGNTQADPGNTQADPGSVRTSGDVSAHNRKMVSQLANHGRDPIVLMAEPDEGVPLPGAPDLILLGIDGEQIDGYDDFLTKFAPLSSLEKEARVVRKANGYPEVQVRKSLFSRLQGRYTSLAGRSTVRRAIFQQDANSSLGWEREYLGSVLAWLEVNPSRTEIVIRFREHQMNRTALDRDAKVFPAQVLRFKYSTDSDSKRIFLTQVEPKSRARESSAAPMECDNRHFLKLVCKNSEMVFSLSLNGAKSKEMHFRFGSVRKTKTEKRFLDYSFGHLVPDQLNGGN